LRQLIVFLLALVWNVQPTNVKTLWFCGCVQSNVTKDFFLSATLQFSDSGIHKLENYNPWTVL
jgi:hypothetical protein